MDRFFKAIFSFWFAAVGFSQCETHGQPATETNRLRAIEAIEKAGAILVEESAGGGRYHTLICSQDTKMEIVTSHIHHLTEIGYVQIKKIATDEHLKALQDLKLGSIDIRDSLVTDKGVKFLAKHKGLTSLVLSGGKFGDDGLADLCKSEGIFRLWIDSTLVTDRGMKGISQLRKLQILSAGPTVTDASLSEIAKLPVLVELYLPGAPITDKGIKSLGPIKKLGSLLLSSDKLEDDHLKELAGIQSLSSLSLECPKITDKGIVHLARLPNLGTLELSCPKITDKGMEHLATLRNIVTLSLRGTQVTDGGIIQLAGLPRLASLDLRNTKVTDDGKKTLQRFLPNLQFVR